MRKKLTKANIEKLAVEVRKWARENKLGKDWQLFYNGKMSYFPIDESYHYGRNKIKDNVNPLDYCEYFSDHFVMGMSYDGIMYECINGYRERAYYKLMSILENYGLYLEHCDSCHCEFINWDNDEVEFYEPKRKLVVHLYYPGRARLEHGYDYGVDYPRELDNVMNYWREESRKVGDIGACTLGEYIQFDYKGNTYRMSSQSPYQGDWSWREPIPRVKEMLENMGATEIYVNNGRLD